MDHNNNMWGCKFSFGSSFFVYSCFTAFHSWFKIKTYSNNQEKYKLNLHPGTDEVVPFQLQLEDEPAKYYVAETVADTLKNNEDKEVILNIFSRNNMTFSSWGELSPGLCIKITYKYHSMKETLIGGAIGYWPK